ncbi:hypothetical protein [Streptomyces sp. MUM 178J]|nr:hypothetical protein [Streptomyces sp. MUM 178J]WRQ79062.1 hypothetical protein I3F59_006535 [Streptomyces sp. MUM 178J]
MGDTMGIAQASAALEELCRKVATGRERTAITAQGEVLAVLISPE